MGVATAVAVAAVGAGAAVMSSRSQKKAAKAAEKQTSKVRYNPKRAAKDLSQYMPDAFGAPKQFFDMQKASNDMVLAHLKGEVSDSTKTTIGRQMLGTGAVDLGPGAVDQLYGGYLGLTSEDLVTQGNEQYQSLYRMYNTAVAGQAQNQYASDLNRAQGKAASIIAQGNATASMWQGIGSAVGGALGGIGGGGASGFAGAARGASGVAMPQGYQGGRSVGDRPPGV